jgi:hypothetical protein
MFFVLATAFSQYATREDDKDNAGLKSINKKEDDYLCDWLILISI